jgi:hypothetical protein
LPSVQTNPPLRRKFRALFRRKPAPADDLEVSVCETH